MDSDLKFLVILIGFGAIVIYQIRRRYFRRCDSCNGRLRLKREKHSGEYNVNRFVSLWWEGPQKRRRDWRCEDCGEEHTENSWVGGSPGS